jgi:hypothetical protein
MFVALSVFGRRIKGVMQLRPEQVWTCNVTPFAPFAYFTFMMLLAPVTNREPHGVTLAGYCYAVRHGMKVQIVVRIELLATLRRYGTRQRYKCVPTLDCAATGAGSQMLSIIHIF